MEKLKFESEKQSYETKAKAEPLPQTPNWLKSTRKPAAVTENVQPALKLNGNVKENMEWMESESPSLVEESPAMESSEILLESKTINLSTPKAAKSAIKSIGKSTPKSVRISVTEESNMENNTTPTKVAYDLRKMNLKSPFNNRRMPLRNPVATSTPNN